MYMGETKQIHFLVNNQNYGIDIMDIRAVEKYDNVSPIIGAPSYVKGVLNLRGELIPVYSIRRKFNLPDRPVDDEMKLIIVNLPEMAVALEADSVVGILTVEESRASKRPRMLENTATSFIGQVSEVDGKIIIMIDLEALLPKEERKAMLDLLEQGKESQ